MTRRIRDLYDVRVTRDAVSAAQKKIAPDAATQANAVQDLDTQGIDALVILPSDPDPLVNAIKEVKGKGKFVALVDRAPSSNDNSVRDLYVAGNNPALGEVAGK